MTATREFDRRIGAFLEDGPTELPDRTYDEVREAIDRTRQRVVVGRWAEPSGRVLARLAVGAAAVLVACVAAANLLGGSGPPVGGEVPPSLDAPVASPSRLPPPDVSPRAPRPRGEGATDIPEPADSVAAGTYILQAPDEGPVRTTVTLPAGWVRLSGGILQKHSPDGTNGPSLQLSFWTVDNVYTDVCRWRGSEMSPPPAPTVDGLVAAFAQQRGRNPSAATDTTVGGYPAKRIELVLEPLEWRTCDDRRPRSFVSEGGMNGTGGYIFSDGQHNIEYIVDVDGELVLIDTMYLPQTSPADVAEMERVVASVRFEP